MNKISRNEKVESNPFESSIQKVKYWFNIIQSNLILYEWLQSGNYKINHFLGEDVL